MIHSKNVIFDESLFYTNETHEVVDNSLLDKSEDWIDLLFDDVAVTGGVIDKEHLSSSPTSSKDILNLTEVNEFRTSPLMAPTIQLPHHAGTITTSEGDKNITPMAPIDDESDDDSLSPPPPDEEVSVSENSQSKWNCKAPTRYSDPVDSSAKGKLPTFTKVKDNYVSNVSAKYADFSMLSYTFLMRSEDDRSDSKTSYTSNTYKNTIECSEASHWKHDMNTKIQSHLNNDMYKLVPHSSVSEGVKIISSQWVY